MSYASYLVIAHIIRSHTSNNAWLGLDRQQCQVVQISERSVKFEIVSLVSNATGTVHAFSTSLGMVLLLDSNSVA